MLDIKFIRENEEVVRRKLESRGADLDLGDLLAKDQRRRDIIVDVESLKAERNSISKDIGRLKKEGQNTDEIQTKVREMGEKIAELDEELRNLQNLIDLVLMSTPNLPSDTTPVGKTEADNVVVKIEGEARVFDFEPKAHWDLGDELKLFDMERGAKITGSGFPLFTGKGARLERALINFMLDIQTLENGYLEIAPPFIVNRDTMTGTGQLPKFEEDMYCTGDDDLFLIPTAEVPVTNIFRNEILDQELPVKMTAYTPCFRREAGAAGRDTRGLVRVHQFDKVELVKYAHPEKSYEELELLLADAESILKRLGLHYRVIELCTGDMGFGAAKCYDIELWAPAQNRWLEVSSCSNFEDFQARRLKLRFRDEDGKLQLVHTLNGSGVALPRLYVAILENYQNADGSVTIPEALRPYLRGMEKIEK